MGFLTTRPALAIAMTIAGSFVVSFALMWRAQGPAAAVTATVPPTRMSVHDPRALPTVMAQTNAANRAPPARPAPASVRRAPPPPKDVGLAEDADSAAPMPIAINVFNRRNRHRFEGYVANTSNQPLSVTVEVVGAEGRGNSTLRLEVPAGGQQDFSSDSGLDMQSNDQIVVHSDHYQDITAQVP
jgi:hypothetical protein